MAGSVGSDPHYALRSLPKSLDRVSDRFFKDWRLPLLIGMGMATHFPHFLSQK
jgi:hypothetical protein